jgi:type I restriction enzyme, S subunit
MNPGIMMASHEGTKGRNGNGVLGSEGMSTVIPIEHRRLKYVSQLNMGQSPSSEDVTRFDEAEGLPFLQGNAEFGSVSPTYKHTCNTPPKTAKVGDLLVSVRAPVGALNIADQMYGIGRGLCAVTWKSIEPRFGWWAMHYHRGKLSEVATGSTYEAVSAEDLGNLFLSFPDLKSQHLIADYLDRETARIDALVAEKEKMLALLEEKRAALISRAVTRGLDESAPLKPSGLDWLGDIPTHWEVLPLRWFMRIGSGEFLSNESISKDETEDLLIPVVGGNGVLGYTSQANTENALVIGRVGAQCGNVHFVDGPLWVTDNALLVKITSRFEPRYLREVLHLMELNTLANQSAQPLITGEMVKNQKVPAPPISEQSEILQLLKEALGEYVNLLKEVERSLRLLKERRAALITAAVTGQISAEEMSA